MVVKKHPTEGAVWNDLWIAQRLDCTIFGLHEAGLREAGLHEVGLREAGLRGRRLYVARLM